MTGLLQAPTSDECDQVDDDPAGREAIADVEWARAGIAMLEGDATSEAQNAPSLRMLRRYLARALVRAAYLAIAGNAHVRRAARRDCGLSVVITFISGATLLAMPEPAS